MTEKLLNPSVKQPLGGSPNTLLFGNGVQHEPSSIKELDQAPKNATPVSIRAYVDDFMQRQGKLLNAAMRSQKATNEKTYENVMRTILDYQSCRRRISDTILE